MSGRYKSLQGHSDAPVADPVSCCLLNASSQSFSSPITQTGNCATDPNFPGCGTTYYHINVSDTNPLDIFQCPATTLSSDYSDCLTTYTSDIVGVCTTNTPDQNYDDIPAYKWDQWSPVALNSCSTDPNYCPGPAYLQPVPPNPPPASSMCINYFNNPNLDPTSRVTMLQNALSPEAGFILDGCTDDSCLGRDTYVSNILNICKNPVNPANGNLNGQCDAALINACSSYSRNDVITAYANVLSAQNQGTPISQADMNLYQACGCHLSPQNYTDNQNTGINESNGYACDTICQLPGVVPQYIETNGQMSQATCPESICIIDDVTIQLAQSDVAGGINFNVVCGNCAAGQSSGGPCICTFSDINIAATASTIGGGVNFSQNCGICRYPDPNNLGSFIDYPCSESPPTGGGSSGGGGSGGGSGSTTFIGKLFQWYIDIKIWVLQNKLEAIIIALVLLITIIALIWWIIEKVISPPEKVFIPSDEY